MTRLVRTLAAGLCASALAACGSTAPRPQALVSLSASGVLQLALRNARNAGSMHFVVDSTGAGIDQHVVGMADASAGEVTVHSSTGQTHIIVTGGTGYIQASEAGIEAALGLTAAQAAAVANKWVSVAPTDARYANLLDAVSFGATLGEFTPGGAAMHKTTKVVDDHTVVLIAGAGTGTAPVQAYTVQLAVTAQAPVLPLAAAVTVIGNGKTGHQQAVFAQWGKPVTVTAPTGAIAASSLSS